MFEGAGRRSEGAAGADVGSVLSYLGALDKEYRGRIGAGKVQERPPIRH